MADSTQARLPYLVFLGLEYAPFPMVPDPVDLFAPMRIEALLAELMHGIESRKGFLAMSGDVGLGKTTLSRRLIHTLEERGVAIALVFNTALQGAALLRAINRDFGVAAPDSNELDAQLEALYSFLIERYRNGGNSVIIIDDAQNLSDESLEMIRLISNLETERHKLVQILLMGQPELMDKLSAFHLRQLRSRIVVDVRLTPFNREEVEQYVMFKLSAAGHAGRISVTRDAWRSIYDYTRGNPRRINILMDRCLYGLYALDTLVLNGALVKRVASELSLERPAKATRRPAFAWSAAAAASLAVGLLFWQEGMSRVAPPAANVAAAVPARAEAAGAQADQKRGAEVTRFLDDYGLDSFAPLLIEGMRSGNLDRVDARIRESTHWRLVQLPDPEYVGNRRFLVWTPPQGAPRYLVFCVPDIRVDNFHLGVSGRGITAVHKRLAKLGYFHGDVRGEVTDETLAALSAFQRRQRLPETGWPDATTLFMLSLVRHS